MSQILTMAVQNLNVADRDDMVRYMKQAMVGTFFERWLKMGGWIGIEGENNDGDDELPTKPAAATTADTDVVDDKPLSALETDSKKPIDIMPATVANPVQQSNATDDASCSCCCTTTKTFLDSAEKPTSAAELEKLIRAIGTNPNLDAMQKNLTIQGLRDSVWKSNCRVSKRKREETAAEATYPDQQAVPAIPAPVATTSTAAMPPPEPTMRQTHHLRYVDIQCGQWL